MDESVLQWFGHIEKMVDERFDESVLQWFGHIEKMVDDRIANRVYVGSVGSCSVGSP